MRSRALREGGRGVGGVAGGVSTPGHRARDAQGLRRTRKGGEHRGGGREQRREERAHKDARAARGSAWTRLFLRVCEQKP